MRLLQTQLLTSMNTHIAYFKQTVSRHVSSERPVNTSPNWHPCCRQWAWKQAFARTWPLESTWFEAQMRGKHHFHSEATWISKVPKKSVKEQTSICTPGARNASKSKIVEACLRSNCPVARREMLQSARLGGCNRSEPEMRCVWQFAFGCEDYHSYIIRMIERPQQALFNRMFSSS